MISYGVLMTTNIFNRRYDHYAMARMEDVHISYNDFL